MFDVCDVTVPDFRIYTIQNLIRAKILILFAGGPVYLMPKILLKICSTTITLQTY